MDDTEEAKREPGKIWIKIRTNHFAGLLKIEEEIDQGSLVALSPKCYNSVV